MNDSAKSVRVQKPSPIAPITDADVFSAEQLAIFKAIADTVIPSLSPQATDDLTQLPVKREVYDGLHKRLAKIAGRDKEGQKLVDAFLTESATSQPVFNEGLMQMMQFNITSSDQRLLRFLFSTLK